MLEQGPGKNWSWFHTSRQDKTRSIIFSKKQSQLQQDQCFLLNIFRLCLKESRNTPSFVPVFADAAELSHLWKPRLTYIQTSLFASGHTLLQFQFPVFPAYIKPGFLSGRGILHCCPSSKILSLPFRGLQGASGFSPVVPHYPTVQKPFLCSILSISLCTKRNLDPLLPFPKK